VCKAFSCIVTEDCHAKWKFGMDGHEDIIEHFKLKDDGHNFARVEIAPANESYLNPDEWVFKIDERARPGWWTPAHEAEARGAKDEWQKRLDKILVHKPIVHPFRDVVPPKKIAKKHLDLLRQWDSVKDSVLASVWASVWASVLASVKDSVWASVWASVLASVKDSVWASVKDSVWASVKDSVWDSVKDSVWDSVWESVGASVKDSVWASVKASVWDSVGAYAGSFFLLPRADWQYTDKIKLPKGQVYPFRAAVDLWEMGLVPSFDGKAWRLHGGPGGKVLWEGTLDGVK
jgi:hypothetical protein